jgi:hypothetical protein
MVLKQNQSSETQYGGHMQKKTPKIGKCIACLKFIPLHAMRRPVIAKWQFLFVASTFGPFCVFMLGTSIN